MENITKAVQLFIEELNLAGDAEQIASSLPRKAKALLSKADKAMNEGWDLLEGMTERQIAEIRHQSHKAYASRMGWDTTKPVVVFDRSYTLN